MPRISLPTALIILSILSVKPAQAGLFGPDNDPLNAAQIGERLRNATLALDASGKPLEIRTKGAAIGGFLVGMLLSSAMASGANVRAGNPAQIQQQMQANMNIAQQANLNIQSTVRQIAAETDGQAAAESARRGPLPLLMHTLNEAMRAQGTQAVAKHADPKPALVLRLTQEEWKLDFEALSSDYVLKTTLTLELLDTAADKRHLRTACAIEFARKMPLEDWEKNDHLAIALAAREIALDCHQRFALALALPADAPSLPLPEAKRSEPAPSTASQQTAEPEESTSNAKSMQ